jgi:CPA2 family monovalent cation:H+ antiporter-2
MGLLLGRFFLAIAFVLVVISTHFDLAGWTALLLIVGGVVFFLISRRRVRERSTSMESKFFDNLNAKEVQARKNAPVTASIKAKMAGYDVHLDKLEVSADSSYIGLMLKEIPIRDESGANIVKITRGSHVILIPDGEQKVYPGDELLTVGTEEQLAALREMFKASIDAQPEDQSDFDVETVEVKDDSYLNGVSLKSLDIRKSNCMVISVLRGDNMIINPRAEFVFAPGDVVWIAGDTASVEYLKG